MPKMKMGQKKNQVKVNSVHTKLTQELTFEYQLHEIKSYVKY